MSTFIREHSPLSASSEISLKIISLKDGDPGGVEPGVFDLVDDRDLFGVDKLEPNEIGVIVVSDFIFDNLFIGDTDLTDLFKDDSDLDFLNIFVFFDKYDKI